MGEPNNALAVYMNRPDRIRSVLEYYLGEKLPEDWECQEIRGFYTVKNRRGKLSFRQRDFIGKVRFGGVCFMLGLENQDSVNLIFPWRLMEMDCLAYEREIEEIQEQNALGKVKYGAEDDFKYHYRAHDRICPIMNLTLYWGTKRWKNPLCLREMMHNLAGMPEKLQALAGDYKVNLIEMRFIPEDCLQKMDSDLKYVLGIMKHTRSKKQYEKYIMDHQDYFIRVPRSAVDVIDACTGIKDIRRSLQFTLNLESGEEEADMCKALKEIKRDAEKQGIRQGNHQINKLIQLLLAEGRQEDLLRSTRDVSFQQKLIKEFHI